MQEAKFSLGQIVYHKRFNYRGVIFDVDPVYCGTEAWYETMAKSRPPKDAPWYHVLVDNAQHNTYVAEKNLQSTEAIEPVNHPLIDQYFKNYTDGRYLPVNSSN